MIKNTIKKAKEILLQRKSSPWILYFGLAFLLAIFKIYLISTNEILALNKPHDELWYITSAVNKYWLARYDHMAFIHLPVYPVFIFIIHLTGVPLRLVIELFYLIAGFYFSTSLVRIGLSKLFALLAFALTIFHPITFWLFDHTLSETLYGPMLLLAMGNVIYLLFVKGKKIKNLLVIFNGFVFGLLYYIREESDLVTLMLLFFLFLITALYFFKNISKIYFIDILKKIVIIPTLFIVLFSFIIYSLNWWSFGTFAKSDLHNPHYKSANSALQSIDFGESIRFIPVTRQMRQAAYEVSPSFRELKPYLENEDNWGAKLTKLTHNIDNEIGGGFWYWVLRGAVHSAGYTSRESSNEIYSRIAAEVNQAFSESRLNKKAVFMDFIDLKAFKYLSEYPDSLFRVGKLLFTLNQRTQETDGSLPPELIELVNHLANRRDHLVNYYQPWEISGWVSSESQLRKVEWLTSRGDVIDSTSSFVGRTDIKNAKHFSLLTRNKKADNNQLSLKLSFSDDILNVDLDQTELMTIYPLPLDSDSTEIQFALEKLSTPPKQEMSPLVKRLQHFIWIYYGTVIRIIAIIALILILPILFLNSKKPNYYRLFIIFSLTFVIFSRIALFALVDTIGWDAEQSRYIFPVMPLFSTLSLLIIDRFIKVVGRLTHESKTKN